MSWINILAVIICSWDRASQATYYWTVIPVLVRMYLFGILSSTNSTGWTSLFASPRTWLNMLRWHVLQLDKSKSETQPWLNNLLSVKQTRWLIANVSRTAVEPIGHRPIRVCGVVGRSILFKLVMQIGLKLWTNMKSFITSRSVSVSIPTNPYNTKTLEHSQQIVTAALSTRVIEKSNGSPTVLIELHKEGRRKEGNLMGVFFLDNIRENSDSPESGRRGILVSTGPLPFVEPYKFPLRLSGFAVFQENFSNNRKAS